MRAVKTFLLNRLKSVGYALDGLRFMLGSQHNARVHLVLACFTVALAFITGLSQQDWLWVLLMIGLVWFAEAMNTAFEHLCDVVSPQFSEDVRRAKDVAAGAVLICATLAAVTGLIIFLPYWI